MFVSSSLGDDGNDGSKGKPFATLGAALAAAATEGVPVYACAETFQESVMVSASVVMYGGLGCTDGWVYVGATKKTTLTAAADEVPLRMSGATSSVRVEDFAVVAVDAAAAGGSSIAVIADSLEASLVRCELTSGSGVTGMDGADALSTPPTQPAKGNDGKDACSGSAPILGGNQVTNDCGGVLSIGGTGGSGNDANGGDGQGGLPPITGKGGPGKGEFVAGWDCSADGVNGGGQTGGNGLAGASGVGASGIGALTSSGYAGTSGTAGQPGVPGQGGGGGGGAKGGNICPGAGPGASGGSGGAGGCGGEAGQGAGPGGSSIALVSLSATVTLKDTTLKAGAGGDGGAGGDLQPGASGGLSGIGGMGKNGSLAACDGGKGGQGGNGGPGGGGLGGHSLAVAFTGEAVMQEGATTLEAGAPGVGGLGGSGNAGNNGGANGVAGGEQQF